MANPDKLNQLASEVRKLLELVKDIQEMLIAMDHRILQLQQDVKQ